LGIGPAIAKAGKENGQMFCRSAPASHIDIDAQTERAFAVRIIQNVVLHSFCATPHQNQSRNRPPVV
jgi:hypothetical protein